VNHGALIEQQADAATEQVAVEAAGQPVSDDVVGLRRNDDAYVDTASRGSNQGGQHVCVRDEVRVRQIDVV